MELILPPGMDLASYERALEALRALLGEDRVLATDMDRQTYLDLYAPGPEAEARHAPAAAVVVQETADVQAVVRLANQYHWPLCPISRGKNFGYGGAAPVMAGALMLDMSRMNRILEVDPDLAYCVVEPGVGFFDLHEHLQENDIPLWLSIPGNGWGSVLGNALERGFSRTPYGDHTHSVCGLEVVLPDGEIVRTGTGAMSNSKTWALFKNGFGPGWDQMFSQSNLGIVTKMGLWLMPAPPATLSMSMSLPNPEDIGWLVDVITPLRIQGVIPHNVGVANFMGSATTTSQRSDWYQGEGALTEEAAAAIMAHYGVGWWNFTITLYGEPEVNELHRQRIEEAVYAHTEARFRISHWRQGEAGGAPSPTVFPLRIVNWHGGRGGHIGFSPILPGRGQEVLEQVQRTRARYADFGIDYSTTFYLCGRHVVNVNLMLYDKDDADLVERTNGLFSALIDESAAAGFGEYRTHLSYMDAVARSFDFNDHALLRLNERVKDALDPQGILAPGKSGIWPARYRENSQG